MKTLEFMSALLLLCVAIMYVLDGNMETSVGYFLAFYFALDKYDEK